jgi:GAF domain-containing protein
VPNKRLLAILELLAREERRDHPDSLCSTAAALTKLSGAGITLSSPGPQFTVYCASDDVARNLLDIEVTLGEGPGIEACRSDVALNETDLLSHGTSRWIAYSPAAVAIGARAVWGFPVRIGAIRIGALILYRDLPGPLSDIQESDAYLLASVVGRAILATRAGASQQELADELGLALSFDSSVHQAAGMVAVQGGLGLSDAFVALRAHAFSSGVSMAALAESVVRRDTHYNPGTRAWQGQETSDP